MKAVTRSLAAVLVVLVLCLAATACSSSASTGTIKIPLIAPMTGDNMQYGASMKLGTGIRVEEFNAAGGLNGRMVEIEIYDDKNDAKETVNIANSLLDNPDLFLVLGPFSSTCAMAISPLMQKAEVILYALFSSHPDATSAGDWIFRGPVTQAHTCKEYAKFVYEGLKMDSVGIVYLNNDWGKSVNDQFTKEFEALGGTITNNEAFMEGTTRDFTPMLTKIKDNNPDAIFMVAQYNDSATAFSQMESLDLPQQRLMVDSSMRGELLELAGDVLEGAYGVQSFFLENDSEMFQNLRAEIKSRTGNEINSFDTGSYDNMGVVLQAIKETGGTDKYKIKEYMTNLKDFEGLAGVWGFDETRSPTKPLYVLKVEGGKFVMHSST